MGRRMSFDFGLEKPNACFKRKYRWLFKIEDVSAEGVNSLPPLKSARPSLSFKEMEAQHLNETVYFPGKPDWKPVALTLYDIRKNRHPVFEWIKRVYDPQDGTWKPSVTSGKPFKIASTTLELYDGCGEPIEIWRYEGVWPQTIEFGELEMSNSDVIVCDLTLRYDRAYIVF
jgi:hypothetical protein